MKLPQIQYKGFLLILVFLLSNLFCSSVFAYEEIDENRLNSVTVVNLIDGEPIEGVEFQIYRVANITETDPFEMIDCFQDSGVSLSIGATQESWFERAATLEAYLSEQNEEDELIEPVACATTNENGVVTFHNLDSGLYLLLGKETKDENTIYVPLESLIPLPFLEEDGTWNYNPTTYIKNQTRLMSNRKIDLSVVKIWDDVGYENERPSQVTVTLYRDHTKYSTVELNAENNWRYTWKQLSPNSDWDLVEREVPSGYTVTSVLDGRVFVVTNTRSVDISSDPTPTPEPSEAPDSATSESATPAPNESPTPNPTKTPGNTTSGAPISEFDKSPTSGFDDSSISTPNELPAQASNQSPTNIPDESLTSASNETITPSSSTSVPTLPQTGQLWWPVSIFSVGGLILFVIGWAILEKGNKHHEQK